MLRGVGFLYRYLLTEPTATANTLTISHTSSSDKSSLFSMYSVSQFPYHSDDAELRGIFKAGTAATPSNIFTIPVAADKIFGDSSAVDQSDARPTHDLGALSQGQ